MHILYTLQSAVHIVNDWAVDELTKLSYEDNIKICLSEIFWKGG